MSDEQGVGVLQGEGEAANEQHHKHVKAGTGQETKEQTRMRKATGLHCRSLVFHGVLIVNVKYGKQQAVHMGPRFLCLL